MRAIQSAKGNNRNHTYRPKTSQSFRQSSPAVKESPSKFSFSHTEASNSVNNLTSQNSTIKYIQSNHAKLALLLQAKDEAGRGLLSLEDFQEALCELGHPGIDSKLAKRLVNSANARSGLMVRYKAIIDTFAKNRRPPSGSRAPSDLTSFYGTENLYPLAKKVWEKKLVLASVAQQGGMKPRVALAPSELLSLLKKSGVNINIHQLKALLRVNLYETASVLDLLGICRGFVSSGSTEVSSLGDLESTQGERLPTPIPSDPNFSKIRNNLAATPLSKTFAEATKGKNELTAEEFVEYMNEKSRGTIKPIEASSAFNKVSRGRSRIGEEEFVSAFQDYNSAKIAQNITKRLKKWLREEKLTSEQAFKKLCEKVGASEFLDLQQFAEAMNDFGLNSYDSYLVFCELDTKQDRVLDLAEWTNKIYEEYGPFQSLRDIILQHGIEADDLLIKMNIGDKQKITIEDLTLILQRMDPTLTTSKAVDIARESAGKKGYLDTQEFLLQLSQEPRTYEGDWKEQILRKIQNNIKGNPQALKKHFEKADTFHKGKLSIVDFQDSLYRAKVGLQDKEIERLARILDRKNNRMVDYTDFLEKMHGEQTPAPDPLKNSIIRMKVFIDQNKTTPAQLIKKLGNKVTVSTWGKFLKLKINKKLEDSTLQYLAEKYDVNKDGYIDAEDLTAVLNGESYLEMQDSKPFPTKPLDTEKAKDIVRKIRHALVERRINYKDAFNLFDKQQKGILTAKEFSDGLESIIELSKPIKNGLFAVMDRQKIGIVDYKNFLKVMKDNEMESTNHEDSWTWEKSTLNSIKQWINSQGLTVEDAFRVFDKDFDGVVNFKDLRSTLVTNLKFKESEIASSRLERLYKLLDNYKRNSVQLSDFKLLFEENKVTNWKQAAKQQIGIKLSKEFSDWHKSFESISELTGKITFQQFETWTAKSQALKGFNLTKNLLQQLFAHLDPQRKGYLSEKDWRLAFGKFNWPTQCLSEFKDCISCNFTDPSAAFSYFNKSKTGGVTYEEFKEGVNSIIPNRFSLQEIESMWNKICESNQNLTVNQFRSLFENSSFSRSSSKQSRLSRYSRTGTLHTPFSYVSYKSHAEDPIKRLQQLIKASPNSLKSIFKSIDKDGNGYLSAIEFRKALRQLNLGLTAREIDLILLRVDTNADGKISWKEFENKFKASEVESTISNNVSLKLKQLGQRMSGYMLSPKDAFGEFDKNRTGHLDFNAFKALLKKVSEVSNTPMPSFPVMKDLFQLIDIRHDGLIDLNEWLSAFKPPGSRSSDASAATIARNRKVLQLTFEAMSKDGYVTHDQARNVLGSVLKEVPDHDWSEILRVGEKKGLIDYKFLLDIYKDRAAFKQKHPKV